MILLNFSPKFTSCRLGDQSAVLFQGSVQPELGVPGEEDRPGGLGFVVFQPGHQFSRLQAPLLRVDQGPWFWSVPIGIPNTQPGALAPPVPVAQPQNLPACLRGIPHPHCNRQSAATGDRVRGTAGETLRGYAHH